MKRIGLMIGAALALSLGNAQALTPQQEKMQTCNAEANRKSLKGEDRQAFMKNCLSADQASLTPQQQKMKSCNADATSQGLKGPARKAFLSECLKAPAAAPAPASPAPAR